MCADFRKNYRHRIWRKTPLFTLRLVPCGQIVTRSKVTNIRIKSVAHDSNFYQFIHGNVFPTVVAKHVAVNKLEGNWCYLRLIQCVYLWFVCTTGMSHVEKNWHLLEANNWGYLVPLRWTVSEANIAFKRRWHRPTVFLSNSSLFFTSQKHICINVSYWFLFNTATWFVGRVAQSV